MALIASLSYGGIKNSKHDLSHVSGTTHAAEGVDEFLNNYGEVCVYCHAPHGATSSALLWNRSLNAPGSYTLYGSNTMVNTPTTVSTVSLMCLSCHDGTFAVDMVSNAPGSGVNTSGPWYGVPEDTVHAQMGEGSAFGSPSYCGGCHDDQQIFGETHDARASYLTTDLSNDHPVSMAYPDTSTDPYFKTPAQVISGGLRLYESGNKVECSSCHNVHNPAITPFLRKASAGGVLCTTCHNK
ncbi:MAG: hypothetical protein HY758_08615 [Nitrospirae bacterium]|nr:hypothetical protein [Nitrospirota bacterium]